MSQSYYLEPFIKGYVALWIEDIKNVFGNGAELTSLKISGDYELHFLSHIEYVTSDEKEASSFLGAPEFDELEFMESSDDDLEDIIEMLTESFKKHKQEVEADQISEEFSDVYRCCVDHITLIALDQLLNKLSDLNINITKEFQYGLYRHDDSSLTDHKENDVILKNYINEYTFNEEQIQLIAKNVFGDDVNRDWLVNLNT